MHPCGAVGLVLTHYGGDDGEDCEGDEGCEDGEGDFYGTVGTVARDVAGAGVDEDSVGGVVVAVDGEPEGEEDVLVRYAYVLGVEGRDLLVVAADVLVAEGRICGAMSACAVAKPSARGTT